MSTQNDSKKLKNNSPIPSTKNAKKSMLFKYKKSLSLLLFVNGISILFLYLIFPFSVFFILFILLICLNIFKYFSFFLLKIKNLFPSRNLNQREVEAVFKNACDTDHGLESENLSNIEFIILETKHHLSFAYQKNEKIFVFFSKPLFHILSIKEKQILLKYYLKSYKHKYLHLLSVTGNILDTINSLSFYLLFPFRLFSKKAALEKDMRREERCFLPSFFLKYIGKFLGKIYLQIDKHILPPEELARVIWKLQSLHKIENVSYPVFLTPLIFGNSLEILGNKENIALQYDFKYRIKALIHTYPPW